jgi:hypothetical protein
MIMKKNKLFIFLMLALPAMLLQSCLKDQEDTFDKSSSLRSQEYMENAKKTLVGSQYGWVFEYYPESSQIYGGYTYTLKFSDEKVTVMAEQDLNDGNNSVTTYYSIKNDFGPVLSFDTYNELIHFFSTPSRQMYQAYQGDFEFVIDSVGADAIKVHGKRSQNVMYLYKLTEPAETYLAKLNQMSGSFFIDNSQGNIGSNKFDLDYRQVTFDLNGSTETRAYNFTDKGLRLYKPIIVNGKKLSHFAYDDDTMTLTCLDEGATDVKMNGTLISDYILRQFGLSGTTLAYGDEKNVTIYHAKHHNLYQFESTADWLKLTTEGEYVTITVDENNEGHMRSAKLKYTYNGKTQELVVAQCDFDKDIAGEYMLSGYSSDGKTISSYPAVFGKSEKGAYQIKLTVNEQELIIPVTYDTGAARITFGSAIFWGKLELSAGTAYIYPIFGFSTSSWTAYNTGYYYNVDINYDEASGKTGGVLYGNYSSKYPFKALYICAFTQEACASANWWGYIDQLYSPWLEK